VPVVAIASGLLTAIAIVAIDRPIARALGSYEPLALWDRIVDVLEWTILFPVWRFALPVALVAGMLGSMAVPRWRVHAPGWMLIAGVHLVSRLTVNWIKDATGRLRPEQWVKAPDDETFGLDGISFPSGHVVLLASLAIPLAVVFPRLRWPAVAVVVLISAGRIGVNAHFLGDALGAITLVALWTWAVAALARPLPASPR
jgi:membrane-associated phospholipid phosphatase